MASKQNHITQILMIKFDSEGIEMAKQRSKNNSAATGGGIGGAILGICIAFMNLCRKIVLWFY